MKTTFSPRHFIALSAVAFAASAFAAPPPGDLPGPAGAGSEQLRTMHGMKGMARLHDDLKLDARQEALWQDAAKAGREAIGGMRERMRKEHDETLVMLSQPGADLHALAKRMDDFRAQVQQQHLANRERWLAVYDALNAEQKEKARLFVKSSFERMPNGGVRGRGRS